MTEKFEGFMTASWQRRTYAVDNSDFNGKHFLNVQVIGPKTKSSCCLKVILLIFYWSTLMSSTLLGQIEQQSHAIVSDSNLSRRPEAGFSLKTAPNNPSANSCRYLTHSS